MRDCLICKSIGYVCFQDAFFALAAVFSDFAVYQNFQSTRAREQSRKMSNFTEQVLEAIGEADVQLLGSDDIQQYGEGEPCGEDAQENNPVVTPVSPYISMEFSSHENGYDFYNAYAKFKGFGIRKGHSEWSRKKDVIISRTFVCDKEGFKYMKDKREEGKDVFRKADKRVGCKAKMTLNLDRSSGKWIVKTFIEEHNGHELTTPSKVMKHFSHQTLHRGPATAKFIGRLDDRGVRPTTICKVLNVTYGNEEQSITPQQCQVHLRKKRKNNIGEECVSIIRQFEAKRASDKEFYFAMELNDDFTMRSVFWADGRARTSYLQFGDVVSFDTTYNTNNLKLPFAPFTGVNHHRQSTLFGCALLADETEETFTWLFTHWLRCMSGVAPLTIITDQDKAMCGAIHRIFPKTRHRLCSWHLGRNSITNLQSLRSLHGEEVSINYNKWYWSRSEEDFEMLWEEMKVKYGLDERSWLTTLYNLKDHWVPLFLKNTFVAGMTSTQRSEGINAYFDGYVNAQTELHDFVKQYDAAVGDRRASELREDFRSKNSTPLLISDNPLEKQARGCYTRNIFDIFQQEFKSSNSLFHTKIANDASTSTYSIWSMNVENESEKRHIVVFDDSDAEVSIRCTCAKFENEGILCKHCLHILVKKQVVTIPSQYIMKRWMLAARHVDSGVVRSCVPNSEDQLSIIKHWALSAKCDKALEGAMLADMFHEEFDNFLVRFLKKVEDFKERGEGVDIRDTSNRMPISSISVSPEQASQVTLHVRDPDGPVATKGRPPQASRIKPGIDLTQANKKQRTCGFCKEKGHYITSCAAAKMNNEARGEGSGGGHN